MYIYSMSKFIFIFSFCCFFLFLGRTTVAAQDFSTSKTTQKLIKPPYLKAGDSVAIVAPSGILRNRKQEVATAKQLLESWGLKVVVGKHVFSQANHFAGTDNERCEDFQNALDNPNIKAIWAARGGYGAARILDKLDYSMFLKQPKWVVGYSDITALHNQINTLGVESLHALMAVSLGDNTNEIKESIATFKAALFGKSLKYDLEGSKYNKIGETEGQLVGGNLTILHTMLGSNTSLDMTGKILFIEEIGEYAYHIDRMLQSLKRAGYFENCKGIIVGDMSKVRKNTTPWGTSIQQLILDVVSNYNFPVAFNMPAGHENDNRALILGRTIQLQVFKEGTSILFEE